MGLYTGAEIYQALVGETNPYNLPAQFALSFIECIQGNVAPAYYTYTVNCAADSTDTLRCVQFPRGSEPPTVAELQTKIYLRLQIILRVQALTKHILLVLLVCCLVQRIRHQVI